MMGEWLVFVSERSGELWSRTGEHLILTGVSTFGAIFIGVPVGVLASKVRVLRTSLTGMVGILQTVPSLAMLAILLALTDRIGVVPAIIALTLYALLPIVRNTLIGIEQVPPASLEAARGLGMTGRQTLFLVEIPLALPTIIAGIRTASVVGVGIATLSAFIGAGGLGEFINRGLALSNTRLILLGAIPAAILALIVDGSIGAFQWAIQLRAGPTGHHRLVRWVLRPAAFGLPILLAAAGAYAALLLHVPFQDLPTDRPIRIASKNFTEQMVLGELLAQMIEHHTDHAVERRFNLGGTMICHEALRAGEVDMYPEYVGTALTAILGLDASARGDDPFRTVKEAYERLFDCRWFEPFGFENTYALAVTQQMASRHRLGSISDIVPLASRLRAGFSSEFMEREDGYPGLTRIYGLSFASVKDLDPSLMYQALASGELDVISAFSTDGRIRTYDLVLLEDDREFFPPYHAAPVVRQDLLRRMPELAPVIGSLSGRIRTETMRNLNFRVDQDHRRPQDVAREFLVEAGLLQSLDQGRLGE